MYIAPVLVRSLSRAEMNDTIKISTDNIYFDILELVARRTREKIKLLRDSTMNASDLSKSLQLIVKEMHEDRLRLNRKFHNEMFRDKKENALLSWQLYLEKELVNSRKWETRTNDCERFVQNRPIVEGIVEDENSNPPLLNDYEQVLGRSCWHSEFCQISRFVKFNNVSD